MTLKKTKKRKPRIIRRRAIGIQVIAGGKALPHAYLLYDEMYDDGTSNYMRGHSVHTVESSALLNARTKKEKQWAQDEYKPLLFTSIHAAAILIQQIEGACLELDGKRGLKEL